jgi:hypothetical protein
MRGAGLESGRDSKSPRLDTTAQHAIPIAIITSLFNIICINRHASDCSDWKRLRGTNLCFFLRARHFFTSFLKNCKQFFFFSTSFWLKKSLSSKVTIYTCIATTAKTSTLLQIALLYCYFFILFFNFSPLDRNGRRSATLVLGRAARVWAARCVPGPPDGAGCEAASVHVAVCHSTRRGPRRAAHWQVRRGWKFGVWFWFWFWFFFFFFFLLFFESDSRI